MRRFLGITAIVVLVLLLGYLGYRAYSKGKQTSPSYEETATGQTISDGTNTLKTNYIANPKTIDYGVEIYPNSSADDTQGASSEVDLNGTKSTIGSFKTGDSVAQVISYYKSQMGFDSTVSTASIEGGKVLNVVSVKTLPNIAVTVYDDSGQTRFVIYKK